MGTWSYSMQQYCDSTFISKWDEERFKMAMFLKLVRTPLNVYFTAFKSTFLYLSISLCTYYLGWMSCLISFERCQSNCEEHGKSEHYQKFLSMVGFEPPTPHPLPSSVSLSPLGYRDIWRHEIRTFTVLITLWYYKFSVWCAKAYKENKNKIVAYLQFGDWYHLNTCWFTQMKKKYSVLSVNDFI